MTYSTASSKLIPFEMPILKTSNLLYEVNRGGLFDLFV